MSITLQDLTREPDFLEKTLYYCEKTRIFQCVSISAKITRPLEDDLVYGALRSLVLKYPLLFSYLDGTEPHIRYHPVDQILFHDVYSVNQDVTVCFKEEGAPTGLLTDVSFEEAHRNKAAMWRLVYYPKTGWLTFHSAHCFTDGGSVVAYLKEFVESLNHVTGRKSDVLFSLEDDLPKLKHGISPGFFARVNYQTSLATRLLARVLKSAIYYWPGIVPNVVEKKRFESFFIDRVPEAFDPATFFESDQVIGEKSRLNSTTARFVCLDMEVVHTLLAACRANNVKLQTYILLVYVHTINELYAGLYTEKHLKTAVAASFRNRFPDLHSHNAYLGNDCEARFDDGLYTYAATFLLEPGTRFTWDAVRKYHAFLHAKVNSAEWISQYYIADRSMSAENYMDHRMGHEKDTLFLSSTNLGHMDVLQYDDDEKFQIDDILFAPSAGALMGTHHVTVSCTAKGGLNIGFTDGDSNVDDWGKVREALRENLVRLSQT